MAARLSALIVIIIVSATLIAGLIVGAQRDDNNGPVDLIILNGKVYSGDDSGTVAEAVAVRGNQILRVGTNRAIKRLRRSQTSVIDAHGGSVLPAFNDGFVHLMNGAMSLRTADLRTASSAQEVLQRIRAFAESHPEHEWVVGRGWLPETVPPRDLTRSELDAIVPDRPAYVIADNGLMASANSKALALAGITKETRSPKGGTIVKDARTREPIGLLKDAAVGAVERLPQVSDEDRRDALQDAIVEAHRFGITSVQNRSGSLAELELLDQVRQAGDLTLRVYATLAVGPGFSEKDAEAFEAIRKRFPDDPVLKTGAVSLVVALGDPAAPSDQVDSRQPQVRAEQGPGGTAIESSEELTRLIELLDKRGWQIAVAADGDPAVKSTLDAFELVADKHPAPAGGRRHRIDVSAPIQPAEMARATKLGVIVALAGSDAAVTEPTVVDPVQTATSPPLSIWASVRDGGAPLTLGSGWPAYTLDPRSALQTIAAGARTADAVAAATAGGSTLPVSDEESREHFTTGLAAYTRGAAYASFDEHRKGVLARGMLADIVILTGDIFELLPDRLDESAVAATIFGGKVVYSTETDAAPTEP